MPEISVIVLLGIADRAASQYKLINDAFEVINDIGGGMYYTRISATQDSDVELPLIKAGHNVDTGWDLIKTVKTATPLHEIITNMETHFKAVGHADWDAYLTAKDKRLSDFFNQIHFAFKTTHMLADNIFSEADDLLASASVSSGPTLDFTDGINYGDGTPENLADGTNFAASQLRIKVVDAAIGATDLDVDIVGKDENGDSQTVPVVIPASTAQDAFIDVGTSANRFRDITNIIYTPSSDKGTVGDAFEVRNKKERQIAL